MFELDGRAFAFVVEGLGTKSIVARQVLEELGINRFADVAYDTVAAILNDLCCVGALPLVVNAYFATGASEWYREAERAAALLEGWRRACADAGCTWGGGESPSLPGLLDERDIELAGAAVGVVPEGRSRDPRRGARRRAMRSCSWAPAACTRTGPRWRACWPVGCPTATRPRCRAASTLGEALLEPSVMYVPLVAELLQAGLAVTYISHVTGHGLLKLMRPAKPLTYRIDALPEVPEVLSFLVARAGLDAHAAYSTFNMGSGYAVYCAAGGAAAIVQIAEGLGLSALVAGRVEEGPRQVILEPVDVRFAGAELELSGAGPEARAVDGRWRG